MGSFEVWKRKESKRAEMNERGGGSELPPQCWATKLHWSRRGHYLRKFFAKLNKMKDTVPFCPVSVPGGTPVVARASACRCPNGVMLAGPVHLAVLPAAGFLVGDISSLPERVALASAVRVFPFTGTRLPSSS